MGFIGLMRLRLRLRSIGFMVKRVKRGTGLAVRDVNGNHKRKAQGVKKKKTHTKEKAVII